MEIKLKDIVTGWSNVINDKENELAEERINVCSTCPNKQTMLGVDICGLCFCPLIAKTKSPETKCPLNKWIR